MRELGKDRQHRDRVCEKLMMHATPAERRPLRSFPTSASFEWRFWGLLETLSCALLDAWAPLKKYFHPEVLSEGASDSGISFMDRALRNEPGGVECVELMFNANAVIASAVGHNGRWPSDCHCHSEAKLTKRSYQGRRRMLENMGLADGLCMWGGRRGVPLALGAIEELVGNVSNADSESYREAMVAASPVHRGIVKKYEVHVKGRYADIMRCKFGLWRQMPCIIVGSNAQASGGTRQLNQCTCGPCDVENSPKKNDEKDT